MTTKKQFYRPDEVAEILSISVDTVYKLIANNQLHAVKIASVWRIPAASIASIASIASVSSSETG